MLFNSLPYLLFLPVVVVLYWLAGKRQRPLLLLVASYFFYMSWFAKYGLLIGFLTLANYIVGLALTAEAFNKGQKKAAFVCGLVINLGCLIFFKYTNFLLTSLWRVASLSLHLTHQDLGFDLPVPHAHILLPLGISFFVFEFIHYLSDIYRGSPPIKDPIHFGLFAAFFPSQIAGPIKRYQDFEAQVLASKPFDASLFISGCWLIAEGMFKKVVLSDNLAVIVQKGFGQPHNLIMTDAWLCTIAFALQIYYDFSGYTDIGRGSAMLFGFRLPENFNKPYFATSIIDFWHRWHMSLSTWLRDYLYKPLGGSRTGHKNRNLMITMLLGGLWHGASWHFVLWGAFHGLGLICNHWWRQLHSSKLQEKTAPTSSASSGAGMIATFLFVLVGWVLFRANSAMEALVIYRSMFDLSSLAMTAGPCLEVLLTSALPIGFIVYGLFQLIKYFASNPHKLPFGPKHLEQLREFSLRWWLTPPPAAQVVSYLAWAVLILAFSARKPNPFIYFQF
jgi:D-alanyl-lipoteichoic acid acyltransferase DltB (MBOAT superfamily)